MVASRTDRVRWTRTEHLGDERIGGVVSVAQMITPPGSGAMLALKVEVVECSLLIGTRFSGDMRVAGNAPRACPYVLRAALLLISQRCAAGVDKESYFILFCPSLAKRLDTKEGGFR